MNVLRSICLVLSIAALALLGLGGFVTVWDSDVGQDVFVVDVNATAIGVFVVAVVVLSAAVLSFRWSWATWLQLAASASAIALTLGVRGSVVSDAVKVNEYIAVEGGVGGIDSRITRIAPGNITNVDPDIINVSWAIGAGLFLVIALISSGTVSLRRRRSSSGPDVTIVPV